MKTQTFKYKSSKKFLISINILSLLTLLSCIIKLPSILKNNTNFYFLAFISTISVICLICFFLSLYICKKEENTGISISSKKLTIQKVFSSTPIEIEISDIQDISSNSFDDKITITLLNNSKLIISLLNFEKVDKSKLIEIFNKLKHTKKEDNLK